MVLPPLLVALALGWAPPSETQRPPEERITAPPPPGGSASGGAPPSPRLAQQETPAPTSRPGDLGLERLPDGSYRYIDPQRRFTMTVAPDGRAYFADRWRRPSSANSQHGKFGKRPGSRSVVTKPMGMGMQGPLEWLMRASGHDLAASAKMGALRETEAFRTDLAIAWSRAQIQKRLKELPADLVAVWGDESLTLERRREILFDHWDACEDRLGGDVAGIPSEAVVSVDRMRRKAGDEARRTIEAFVRQHLDDEGEGFSAAELERFNARRVSVARFDPYAEPEPEPAPAPPPPSTEDPGEADEHPED